ncbi:MAG: hypothetical protein KC496_07300, partial [Anaerolineae bacterium]|nr:hypothetical protein [Anaerolineae bacterium]
MSDGRYAVMQQTRRKAGWIIFITGVLLLTPIHVLFAQVNIPIVCGSGTPQAWQPTLPGTYFRVIEAPYDEQGVSNYRFEALSASGSQVYSVPFPPEIGLHLFTPSTSPDGRYMVFRPTIAEVGLTIWDLQTNETASLPLQPTDLDYLTINFNLSYQRNNNLLVWLDSRHLLLQYYFDDIHTSKIDWVLGQKVFTIQEAPLAILEGVREDITYPNLPVPEGNFLERIEFSPDHRFATLMTEQTIQGKAGSAMRLQIYDLQNQTLVYDVNPTIDLYPIFKPIWMPDGNTVFIVFISPSSPGPVLELHADQGFREDWSLQQALTGTFGPDAGISYMNPIINSSGSAILFAAYAPTTDQRYLLRYTP